MKKVIVIIIVFALIVALFIGEYCNNIDDIVNDYAETYVSNLAIRMFYETLDKYLSEKGVDYFDIVSIEKDSNGNAKVLSVNTGLLTRIRSETTIILTNQLDSLQYKDFTIPIGTILKSRFFSGQGPKIKIKIVPLGYITSETKNEFNSVGINQSKHTISITYNFALNVIAPFSSASIVHSSTITIAESVIIGDVPNTNITVGNNMANEEKYFVYQ